MKNGGVIRKLSRRTGSETIEVNRKECSQSCAPVMQYDDRLRAYAAAPNCGNLPIILDHKFSDKYSTLVLKYVAFTISMNGTTCLCSEICTLTETSMRKYKSKFTFRAPRNSSPQPVAMLDIKKTTRRRRARPVNLFAYLHYFLDMKNGRSVTSCSRAIAL